jgi:hypothetical protein
VESLIEYLFQALELETRNKRYGKKLSITGYLDSEL